MKRKSSKMNNPFKKMLSSLEKSSILKNKVTLYITLLGALAVLLTYISKSDWNSLMVLVVVGLLTNFFTKNMIITLGTAIVVSLVVRGKGLTEGMEDKEDDKEDEEEDKKEGMKASKKKPKKEGKKCWVKEGDKWVKKASHKDEDSCVSEFEDGCWDTKGK